MNDFQLECEQVVDDFKLSFDKIKNNDLDSREYSEECTKLVNSVYSKLGGIAIKHSIHNGKFGVLYMSTFAYSSRCQRYLEENIL